MLIERQTSSGSLYSLAGQRKYLSCAERADFIAAAMACTRPELRTFCLVLAYAGCRVSEALSLCAGSVNRREGFVAIVTLKKRGRWVVREVPLPASLIEMLADVHELATAAADEPLWGWSRSRAWQLVKEVMAQAGIHAGLHATPKALACTRCAAACRSISCSDGSAMRVWRRPRSICRRSAWRRGPSRQGCGIDNALISIQRP